MSSRPKRLSKHLANTAIGYDSDRNDEDIYDDAPIDTVDGDDNGLMDESINLPADIPPDDIIPESNLHNLSSDDSSDSEPEISTVISDELLASYTSSSGHIWNQTVPSSSGRTPSHNIVNFRQGCVRGIIIHHQKVKHY